MTFEAKLLSPLPCDPDMADDVFADTASGGVALIDAPEGYLLTEGLSLALARLRRHPLWVRLGPEDRDPATFLLSVIAAARRRGSEAGQATLARMREHPGPVFGWPALFAQLAVDLRGDILPDGVVVFEDIHLVSADSPTLSLAGRHLLPGLADAAPCVLVSHREPQGLPTAMYSRKSTDDVRLTTPAVRRLLAGCAPDLTARARERALTLIAGRAPVIAGIRELAAVAGSPLEPLLMRAAGTEDLMLRTVETLLVDAEREDRRVLGLAARVGYVHPALAAVVGNGGQLLPGPWFQRLEEGWARVRPWWRQSVTAVLGRRAMPGRDSLHEAADWLLAAGASDRAISLYLEIGDHDCAARALSGEAATLMDRGEWATVDRLLAELPDNLLGKYPDLSCCRADIAAINGEAATARRWFDLAAAQFDKRGDLDGESRSILAGSAVAAEAGDLADAASRASAARSLAAAADLPQVQMWASWQLGRVALAAGDSDAALASFCGAVAPAAASAGAAIAAGPVRATAELAARVTELRREQEAHRQAQCVLEDSEHAALNQLMTAATVDVGANAEVFGAHGWSTAPAPLKFPVVGQPVPGQSASTRAGRWALVRLRRTLLATRDAPVPPAPPIAVDAVASDAPRPARASAPAVGSADGPAALPAPSAAGEAGELAVHLLGPLYVALEDVAVQDWPSARCRSLLGYLLTHRKPWPPREVLTEAFWPQASPEASRNSLNVAIHALRRTLRSVTETPVVVHSGGVYRINCDFSLWLDFEEFDSRVESARRLEKAGDVAAATRQYEFAANLYRGDFMADDPYEDWAALTRERLRLAYLDALGRLSGLYFDAEHYTACVNLCQRIIERDRCREDAHRRLMRSYSRQGLPHLALMQYRLCAQALADELGVETGPSTRDLHRRIRGHERV